MWLTLKVIQIQLSSEQASAKADEKLQLQAPLHPILKSMNREAKQKEIFINETKDRDSYWRMMQNYVGAYITSMVTLPVLIFEPMTMIQKMAELMEYSYLLDLADKSEDPYMRLVYASSWAISIYFAHEMENFFNSVLNDHHFAKKVAGVLVESGTEVPTTERGFSPVEKFPQVKFAPYKNVDYIWNPADSTVTLQEVMPFFGKNEKNKRAYSVDVNEFDLVIREIEKYKLGNPQSFRYLNQLNCYELVGVSDAHEYLATRRAMDITEFLKRFNIQSCRGDSSSWSMHHLNWLSDLRDQVEHTRILNVVYRFASALGSRLPSIASVRARVARAGAILHPVSSSTQ
ncbi:hypothetical protein IFM89_010887, partial [Coptis chinensis]